MDELKELSILDINSAQAERIDIIRIINETINDITKNYPDKKILVEKEYEGMESEIMIQGNYKLLFSKKEINLVYPKE